MNTFILYYNPKYHPEDNPETIAEVVRLMRKGFRNPDMNWAVWDWQQAHKGDRFFMLRCGSPNPADDGVIQSGRFTSEPWRDEDWSGRGRDVHYMNIEFNVVLNTMKCPVLSSEKLDLRIPNFDWHGGHSGRILDEFSANMLDSLWNQHVDALVADSKTRRYVFDGRLKAE